MECPNCSFVATPGEAAVQGTCPNCERPYRDQPTPLNSDMEMRDMPEPGMEDSGGNPLQEGILGDYQNRGVRDESYASVKKPDIEIPAEVTGILPPDPESIRPDKEQMAKKADFLGDLGDVGKQALPIAGGLAGGAVGALTLNPAGVAAGAAAGAGLGGAAEGALNGEGAGGIATHGLEDAAIGGIGGGLAGGAGMAAADTLGAGAGVGSAAAEDAAAQGATKGGVGSLMKSAWSKVPTQRIKDAYMMNSLMGGGAGGQQQQAAPQMGGQPAVQSPSFYSRTAAPTDTPTSHGEIPSNNTDDPEEVDFNEKNDGEKDGLQSDIAVNGTGGTDLGPDDFFSPDSGALASFAELLPKILQFATGDQSAAGDPDMEDLHQKLEAEKPGYMNSADDDHGSKIVIMMMGDPSKGQNNDDSLQDNDQPHDPISEHEATALRPGLETTCPMCGSVMDASSTHCPQCGANNMGSQPQPTNPDFTTPQQMMNPPPAQNPAMPVTAAGAATQGPVTDEQKAKVAEVLQGEGRAEEIPAMIMEPWNYADILAKITGQEEPPQDIGQPGPPPPVNPAEQQGSMPMPGMSEAPSSGSAMQSAVAKYAATVDGFCEKCPNCGSHSTGYMDYEKGDAGCKTCGHTWKAPGMVKNSDIGQGAEANPIGVPPAEAEGQPNVEQEQDSSQSWTDESGAPLAVGQTYEMYSENYDIPDRIRIDAVKPDVVEYTLVGEYGLDHRTELTHEEASVENISFVPAGAEENEPAPEENQGAQPMDPPPGQQTDLSTPHEMMASKIADFDDINGPYGPNVDQAAPIPCPDCDGQGTDYVGNPCLSCGATGQRNDPLEQQFNAPSTEHPLGPMTGGASKQGWIGPMNSHDITLGENDEFEPDAPTTYDPKVAAFFDDDPVAHEGSTAPESDDTGPTWLMEGVRTAGAHMTPWEQRDYIDESGDARNSDKLQLGGTHYDTDNLSDSFLWG